MPASPATSNPRLPSDHGLPALGLIAYYLSAGVTLYLTLVLFMALVGQFRGDDRLAMVGLLALGYVRAGFHRAAGEQLLRRSPLLFAAVNRYAIASGVTAVAMGALLTAVFGGLTPAAYVAFAVLAMHWPAALLVLVRRRRVAEAFEAAETFDVPLAPRDRSIEGAGVLMTVLGAIGLAGALAGLTLVLLNYTGGLGGFLLALTLALIVARAAYHLVAGVRAVRAPSPRAFSESVGRYLGFALATAGAAALAILVASGGRGVPIALGVMLLLVGLLLFWPLALRRFANQTLLDDIEAEDAGSAVGVAPDRGLTAYGYLLTALGAMALAFAVAKVIAGAGPPGFGSLMSGAFEPLDLLGIASALTTLWAAREVLAMSERRALAIYVFAALQIVTQIVTFAVDGVPFLEASDPSAIVMLVFAAAAMLATPVVGLVLLRRRLPGPEATSSEATPPRGTPAISG